MRSRVKDVIALIGSNGWVEELQATETLQSRYEKLFELVPEIRECKVLVIRNQYLVEIQNAFDVDLGICKFFWIEYDDRRQYCLYPCQDGKLREASTCEILQLRCVLRDGDDDGAESDQDEESEYSSFFC